MKKPEEIKKGLEEFFAHRYEPTFDQWHDGMYSIPDALALIQQLEAENERLLNSYDAALCETADMHSISKAAEAQVPRWISVEERLPEVDNRYDVYDYSEDLLVYDGGRLRVAYYCHTLDVWFDSRYEDDDIDVTHWMPLPEAPKEAT